MNSFEQPLSVCGCCRLLLGAGVQIPMRAQADLSRLRACGCPAELTDVATGVAGYVRRLHANRP